MAFNCDGELYVTSNNEFENSNGEDDEDYLFHKFSNECASNIQLGSGDISSPYIVSGSETWNTSRMVKATITVPAGCTLTIRKNLIMNTHFIQSKNILYPNPTKVYIFFNLSQEITKGDLFIP